MLYNVAHIDGNILWAPHVIPYKLDHAALGPNASSYAQAPPTVERQMVQDNNERFEDILIKVSHMGDDECSIHGADKRENEV